LRTLAKEDEQDAGASCKPFAGDRSGLVLGEGAGIVVLEEMESALARGANIYAEITGFGSANDSSHITQPTADGQAYAMRAALSCAGLQPTDIGYINAHGTATALNDPVETASIKQVFGERAMHTPVSSTKSMHGHLMGATAAVEFIACILALKHQSIPPTMNLYVPDPQCDLDYVPNQGRTNVALTNVMSNSFAFGGTSGVLIASLFKQ
jgi:3-oxoacyl-[acyl-carrier-protein] synthase II